MTKTNAERQSEFRNKLRDMLLNGAKMYYFDKPVKSKKSGIEWQIIHYWPAWKYYELTRTFHSHGRAYTKSILVSAKTLEKNYEDSRAISA